MESVAPKDLESLSNVLAIVLIDRAQNDTLVLELFLPLILRRDDSMRRTLLLTDYELPIYRAVVNDLFLDRRGAFYTTQLQFCAIVL